MPENAETVTADITGTLFIESLKAMSPDAKAPTYRIMFRDDRTRVVRVEGLKGWEHSLDLFQQMKALCVTDSCAIPTSDAFRFDFAHLVDGVVDVWVNPDAPATPKLVRVRT